MALLGRGGILEISREWPEPMALSGGALNYGTSPRTLSLDNESFWTGDRIILEFPDGSPYSTGNAGGYGIYYGSIWELSPARQHVTSEADQYYQADNGVSFYNGDATVRRTTGYINTDQLGRIRLFQTEVGAHNQDVSDEIHLRDLAAFNFVVTRYSADSAYSSAVTAAANAIQGLELPSTSQPLKDVITVPAGLTAVLDDPEQRGWQFQAQIQEWSLDIDASNLDMTAIGQTFGEHTKALVRGAGTLQYLIDHHKTAQQEDPISILRLVLLVQQGCKSNAKFFLYKERASNSRDVGGSVYYQCDLLLTNTRITTRADALIGGSTDFVATGEIGLRIAP